jgi:hypothetical protein
MSTGIKMKSGVTIYGDGSSQTTLKMVNGFDAFHASGNIGMFMVGSGVSNVEIYGFTVNGGCTSLSQMHAASNDYRETNRGVSISTGASHVTVHDMYFTLAMGDSVHGDAPSYVSVYNCQMMTPGHDAVDTWGGSHWVVSNIIVNQFINSGFKIGGGSDIRVTHCTFYSDTGSGYCGVQLMKSFSGVVIDHNVFGPMGNSVHQGVATNTADGPVSGTVSITDNIFYACSGGNIVCSGPTVTNTGNQYPTAKANWVGQGYGFDSSKLGSNSGQGDIIPVNNATNSSTENDTDTPVVLTAYNGSHLPTLKYPTHSSTIETINGQVGFSWEDVNSTKYAIEIANDSSFSNDTVILESLVDNGENVYSQALANGTYWWRLAAYDDVHAKWTDYVSANKFMVDGDEVVGVGGVAGVVFDSVTGHPINNSIVYLYTSEWSGSCVTGSNGVYSFSDISATTYTLYATAQNYVSSPLLAIKLNGSAVTQDMPLQKAQSYFTPNYVTITVASPWGITYPNVEVDVYQKGNDPMNFQPDFSDVTDDNGQVVFPLDKAITHYTIDVHSDEQNIDKEVTISPDSSNVEIWVWNAIRVSNANNFSVNNAPVIYAYSDVLACGAVWQQNQSNMSYANINESFAAIDGYSSITSWSTTVYEVYPMNGSIRMNANNQSNYLYYTSGVGDNSLTISVLNNRSYHVHTEIKDSFIDDPYIYDTQLDTRSRIMQGFDLGWKEQWNYELVGFILLLLMGGLFGARSAAVGSVLVLLMGWLFEYIGWFVWGTGDMLMASFAIILVIAYFLLNGR